MVKTKLSLKLLVDQTNNRVLFAEAGKDFVDFLFHLLSLPIATVAKLMNVKNMVGCIGDLYSSIESLNSDYLQPNINTDSILNPKTGLSAPLLSLTDAPPSDELSKSFYMCDNSARSYSGYAHKYVTDSLGQQCPQCSSGMSTEMSYVVPEESVDVATSSEGYVKGVVTYMVMDHLAVKPMSTISSITLINEFGIKDISCLVEKHVQVTLNEGLAILKSSLETRAVLTTVFLAQPDQNQNQNQSRKKTRKQRN
ncbi:hypothetical protein RND81_10G139100 [Saponaria officinalis]|uniref:DUF674 domain-containing protein n=1 Tax=Saponaria officinalis TaxID=3572 RepID=A0AAW1I486_SAPOF